MDYTIIYTSDELYTMTAGRDLDAAVATTLFGWRWMQYQAPNSSAPKLLTGIFPPDAPNRICVANKYDSIWRPSHRHQPYFQDWDHCAWWQDGELRYGPPHYSTRMDDAWLVVEHLHRHADRRWPWAMLYLTPDAICRAALLSVIEEEAQL